MCLTRQIAATLFGNQSGEHLIDIFSTTSSADFTRMMCGNKIHVGVFSRLCFTEALGSFSKETEAGENVQHAWRPLGGTDISTGLF